MRKSIEKELRTNPKKALLLVLLVVGAGYYWAPIARRWLGGQASHGKAVAGKPILTDDPRPQQATKPAAKMPSWDLLAAAMAEDKQTGSADLTELTRNPFFQAVLAQAEPEPEPVAEEAPPTIEVAIDPRKRFVVTSVVVGPQARFAMVNGEVVRLGDTLVEANQDFKVIAIETTGIKLQQEVQEWELLIDQPQLHKRDRIIRGEMQASRTISASRD